MESINENENLQELSPLTAADILAVELRYEGHSAQDVADKLKEQFNLDYKAQTVRNWFSRNGRLCDYYKNYAKRETKERREFAVNLFQANLEKAVKGLLFIAGKSKSDMVRLIALKEIINRELGEPKKVIQAEVNDPARDILEGAGLLDDGRKNKEDN